MQYAPITREAKNDFVNDWKNRRNSMKHDLQAPSTEQERAIEEFFRQLQREDERRTPSFANLWARALSSTKQNRQPSLALRFAGAMIAVALVVLFVSLPLSQEDSSKILEASKSLSRWRAPTDVLLQSPSQQLLGAVPSFGESFFEMKLPSNMEEL